MLNGEHRISSHGLWAAAQGNPWGQQRGAGVSGACTAPPSTSKGGWPWVGKPQVHFLWLLPSNGDGDGQGRGRIGWGCCPLCTEPGFCGMLCGGVGGLAVLLCTPDGVSFFPNTSVASQLPWMPTTHPRTLNPGAASTWSSTTTAWPSRALPRPSGPGCQSPPVIHKPKSPKTQGH